MATTESSDPPGEKITESSDRQAQKATESSDEPRENSVTPARPKEQSEQKEEEPRDNSHGRLREYSAVLIALIATLGAIATWRAEVAATNAAELTQQGIVIAINLGAEQTQDRAQAMGEAADVARVQQLLDERNAFSEELSVTPPGPANTQLETEYDIAAWVAEWQLRNDWPDNYYLSSAQSAPTYDITQRTSDLVADSGIPTDSATLFARASGEQDRRRELLLLDIGLVIGLACATVAHQLARRSRLQLFCVAAGTAIFTLGLIVFWIVEV
jgi:hypothetical protein